MFQYQYLKDYQIGMLKVQLRTYSKESFFRKVGRRFMSCSRVHIVVH